MKKIKRYFIKSNHPISNNSLSLWLYNNINSNKGLSTCRNTVTTSGLKAEKNLPELVSNRKTSFFKKKSFSTHSCDKNKIDRLLNSSDISNGISSKIDDEIKNMQLLKFFSPDSTENHDYAINDEIDDDYLVYLNDNKIENRLEIKLQRHDDDNNNKNNDNNNDDNIKITTDELEEKKKDFILNDIDNYIICRKDSLLMSHSRRTSNEKITIVEKFVLNDERIETNGKILSNEKIMTIIIERLIMIKIMTIIKMII